VARSSHINAAIETRIVHIATEAVPPTRRVQKRLCQTNHEGLTVVIPFTRLEPGLWELQCSPKDLLTDLMAGAQTHAVTLQVVAHDLEEDWDPDWTSPATLTTVTMPPADAKTPTGNVAAENVPAAATDLTDDALMEQAIASPLQSESAINPLPVTNDRQVPLPPEVSEILGASMERLFQIAEQLSEQLVDDVLQEFDLTTLTSASSSTDVADPVEPAYPGESTIYNSEYATTPVSNPGTTWINGSMPPSQPDGVSLQSLPIHPPTQYTLAAGEAFSLTLDESTFVAARGEEITVSGQVAIVPQSAIQLSSTETPSSVPVAEPDDLAAVIDPWASEASPTFAGATAQAYSFVYAILRAFRFWLAIARYSLLLTTHHPLRSHSRCPIRLPRIWCWERCCCVVRCQINQKPRSCYSPKRFPLPLTPMHWWANWQNYMKHLRLKLTMKSESIYLRNCLPG
jgi:hypothetical protein